MPIFRPHSLKQDLVLFSPKRLVIAATGIQWGKSRSAAVWLKMMMHTHTNPDDNFLICSPTYPIFKQSTLPPFLSLMKDLGRYDRKDECFRMYNGGTCYFRTGKNPDSVVGITRVKGILCDEGGLYTRYYWENILGRSSFSRCPIRIVTSPYSLNWLYQDYIKPIRKDPSSHPDVELIQAASYENPHFPRAEYDEKQRTMDPRRFNMMYGGNFDKMQGLVYDCFDEDLNQCEPFSFPSSTKFYAGIDWGYTDPFVLIVHAIMENGDRYQVHETYKTGLTLPEIAGECAKIKQKWGVQIFYADPSQPGSIEYLCRNGLPTVPANNDIRYGIDMVYEQLKARTFKIFRGTSKILLDELDTYHYPDPKDLKPDQNSKETKPVGQNDHACLAGATLVMTPSGCREIKSIQAGDLVATPLGFRRVIAAGKTGERLTKTLLVPDGRSIEATGDHPFYVPFRGFVPLDEVQHSNRVPEWGKWKKKANSGCLMAICTIGTVGITSLFAVTSASAKAYIGLFGNFITARYRRAIISTIKIMTDAIMTSRILRCSLSSSTTPITGTTRQTSIGEREKRTSIGLDRLRKLGMEARRESFGTATIQKNIGRHLQKLKEKLLIKKGEIPSIESDHVLPRGTEAKKAANGTVITQLKILSELEKSGTKNAQSAKKNSRPMALGPNFARSIVSRLLDVSQALMILRYLALSAGNYLARTSTKRSLPAQGNVVTGTVKKQDVYNLAVDVGCFYANGFLVSNCDALRYLVVMTTQSHVRLTPKSPTMKPAKTEEQKIRVLMKAKR